jgi:hypothetical protein
LPRRSRPREKKGPLMSNVDRPQGPGLKWRPRRHGAEVPYWFASPAAIKAGYPVKSANLSAYADRPAELLARVDRLQLEMQLWLNNVPKVRVEFDGTFKSLLEIYEADSESTFQALKPGVQRSYLSFIPRLKEHIGALRVDQMDGTDLRRWFRQWREVDGVDRLPRAKFILSVFKAAVSFGVMRRLAGVADFQQAIAKVEFPAVKPRTFVPTAEHVIAVRAAAHAAGCPHRALVYALQFETSLRPSDIVGSWLPMRSPQPSLIHDRGQKWVGPMWSAIDENGIIRIRPMKTETTTAVEVAFDLSVCPMVQEDLAHIPQKARSGPLIVAPRTGLPYRYLAFNRAWHADFEAAGLPEGMWDRDFRAASITAGRKAGALKDDLRKVAGHAKEEMTDVYDRDTIEAHRRVMAARNKK